MNRVHDTIFHLNDRMSVLHIAVVGRIPVVFRYDDSSQYNSLPGADANRLWLGIDIDFLHPCPRPRIFLRADIQLVVARVRKISCFTSASPVGIFSFVFHAGFHPYILYCACSS